MMNSDIDLDWELGADGAWHAVSRSTHYSITKLKGQPSTFRLEMLPIRGGNLPQRPSRLFKGDDAFTKAVDAAEEFEANQRNK